MLVLNFIFSVLNQSIMLNVLNDYPILKAIFIPMNDDNVVCLHVRDGAGALQISRFKYHQTLVMSKNC